ncbi:MAG: DUF5518 domain-containing protein [Halobacteriales archaeon]
MTATPTDTGVDSEDSNTLLNALVGAVVTLVTAPLLPFAAIVGGGVAGYLERGTVEEGAVIGAVSGAIAAIPSFFVVWAFLAFLALGGFELLGFASLFGVVVFLGVVGYFVVAGAAGGAAGAYLRAEL